MIRETNTAPSPLEWHPWYRDKTWLLDWLNGRGPYANHSVLRVPVLPSTRRLLRAAMSDESEPDLVPMTLIRCMAWGPAPYVGRPFVYVWQFATDELGRAVAGDSYIFYTDARSSE